MLKHIEVDPATPTQHGGRGAGRLPEVMESHSKELLFMDQPPAPPLEDTPVSGPAAPDPVESPRAQIAALVLQVCGWLFVINKKSPSPHEIARH